MSQHSNALGLILGIAIGLLGIGVSPIAIAVREGPPTEVEVSSLDGLREALERATPGSIIRLAAGTYEIFADDPPLRHQGGPGTARPADRHPGRARHRRDGATDDHRRRPQPRPDLGARRALSTSRRPFARLDELYRGNQYRTRQAVNCFVFEDAAYVVIEELTVRNCWPTSFVFVSSQYVTLRAATIVGSTYAVFVDRRSDHLLVEDSVWTQDDSGYTADESGASGRVDLKPKPGPHVGHGSVGRFASRLASAPQRRPGRQLRLVRQHRRSPQRHSQRVQRHSPSRHSLRASALQRERRDLRQRLPVHPRQPRRARRSGRQLVDLSQPDLQRVTAGSRSTASAEVRSTSMAMSGGSTTSRREAASSAIGLPTGHFRRRALRADLRERMQQEPDGQGLEARAGTGRARRTDLRFQQQHLHAGAHSRRRAIEIPRMEQRDAVLRARCRRAGNVHRGTADRRALRAVCRRRRQSVCRSIPAGLGSRAVLDCFAPSPGDEASHGISNHPDFPVKLDRGGLSVPRLARRPRLRQRACRRFPAAPGQPCAGKRLCRVRRAGRFAHLRASDAAAGSDIGAYQGDVLSKAPISYTGATNNPAS